jgi:hypothetical protein
VNPSTLPYLRLPILLRISQIYLPFSKPRALLDVVRSWLPQPLKRNAWLNTSGGKQVVHASRHSSVHTYLLHGARTIFGWLDAKAFARKRGSSLIGCLSVDPADEKTLLFRKQLLLSPHQAHLAHSPLALANTLPLLPCTPDGLDSSLRQSWKIWTLYPR